MEGMALKGKNVLVTGGCGFYGAHLVKSLVDGGSNVFVVDLLIPSRSYFLQQELDKKVVFENCDVSDFERINRVIVKNDIDYVFHTAALATVEAAFSAPLLTITHNVIGTTNILESCRLYGKVKGILFTSTDKAYGKLPRVDEMKPLTGDHPYEVSKSSADLIARSYYKTYGLPVVVTRFGNVYGEGDLNFTRIVPGVIQSVLKKETLTLRSNGKYIRDYIYVGDVVEASMLLIKNINTVKGSAFNISSKENLSVVGLIKVFEQILQVKIDLNILSKAVNEIPVQSVDYQKIRQALGWKPKNNFKSTVPRIYEWYKSYFNLP